MGGDSRVPRPSRAPGRGAQPHPITFFVTGRERAAILRVLRGIDRDRARALLRALGLEAEGRGAAR